MTSWVESRGARRTRGLGLSVQLRYNLADGLTPETYPSGRAVSFGYDSAGRVMGVSGLSGSTVTEYAGNCTNALMNSCSSPIQYAARGRFLRWREATA